MCEILGIRQGNVGGKYPGLPSVVGRRKREVLRFIRDRLMARIRSWNNKFVSRAGREVLLKTFLQAMPSFAMMVFLMP